MSEAIHFWREHLGQFLSDLPGGDPAGAIIPHRTLKGVKPLRIGSMDLFYIATPRDPIVIGRVELDGQQAVKAIPTESASARKVVAQWLVDHAVSPFMVGVIGKAHPQDSMRVTHHPAKSHFCESGAGFGFNLETVRRAQAKIANLSWKKIVAPAIHQYDRLRHADERSRARERAKMNSLLEQTPELRHILPSLHVLPHSGEYRILSWLNIEGVGD